MQQYNKTIQKFISFDDVGKKNKIKDHSLNWLQVFRQQNFDKIHL